MGQKPSQSKEPAFKQLKEGQDWGWSPTCAMLSEPIPAHSREMNRSMFIYLCSRQILPREKYRTLSAPGCSPAGVCAHAPVLGVG